MDIDILQLPDVERERWSGSEDNHRMTYFVNGKWIMRSRYIIQKHLGRKLENDEVVHHINGDKTDDRIENLQLMTNSEHVRLHNILRQSHLPLTGIIGENHPNWKGDEASDHAKYMRKWNQKKREKRRSAKS